MRSTAQQRPNTLRGLAWGGEAAHAVSPSVKAREHSLQGPGKDDEVPAAAMVREKQGKETLKRGGGREGERRWAQEAPIGTNGSRADTLRYI